MARNIKQVYDTNPSTSLGDNDLIYGGKSPYGITTDTAIKYSDLKAQIAEIVEFNNIIYIADNGNDSTGNGSLSTPLATLAGINGAISKIISFSSTNQYLIVDMRTGVIIESNTALLPPFTFIKGNKAARYNGNIQLDTTKFGTIASAAYTGIEGYYSIGLDSTSIMNIDFHTLGTTYPITLYLEDVDAAILANGSQFIGTDNDPVLINPDATFTVIKNNFNTYTVQGGTTIASDILIKAGISVQCYNSSIEITTLKKSTATTPANTNLILDNVFFYSNTGLNIDLTGGNGGQAVFIYYTNSAKNLFNQIPLIIDNTPQNTTCTFNYDSISPWYLSSIINPSVNVVFNPVTLSEFLGCIFSPTNYTPTPVTEDILTNGIDAHLNGIDIKLGALTTTLYPPNYISGLTIQVNGYTGYIATPGICINSTNTFNMAGSNSLGCDITNPLGPSGLDAGSYANNIEYYFYLINSSTDPITNPPALIISANPTSPSFANAAGYDKFRYLFHAHSQASGTGFDFVEIEGTSNERIYSIGTTESAFTVLSAGNALSPDSILTGTVTNQYTMGVAYKYSFNSTSVTDSFSIQGVSGLVPNFTYTPGIVGIVTGVTPILPVTPIGQTTYFVNNTLSSLTLSVGQMREFI